MTIPPPTERELAILKVLWAHEEATVRQIYEELRQSLPIVQNTEQAFLRTMTEKGLVTYRTEGRSFVYRAAVARHRTREKLLDRVLQGAYDGALDQLVEGAIGLRPPSRHELDRLRALLDEAEQRGVAPDPGAPDPGAPDPGRKKRSEDGA